MSAKNNEKKQQAGFTLVEMAIVLIIIGLIIGAVLKGQDLIVNARAKRFSNFMRATEVAQWSYFDRRGSFVNGTGNLESAMTDYNGTLSVGSSTFLSVVGRENGTEGLNAIVIVKGTIATPATFNEQDLIYAESFDSAIDNSAVSNLGRVRAATAVTGGDAGTVVSGLTSFTLSTATDWSGATNVVGLVYYFDEAPSD